jgi:hypothetical protein
MDPISVSIDAARWLKLLVSVKYFGSEIEVPSGFPQYVQSSPATHHGGAWGEEV